jgi:hypothetical protein
MSLYLFMTFVALTQPNNRPSFSKPGTCSKSETVYSGCALLHCAVANTVHSHDDRFLCVSEYPFVSSRKYIVKLDSRNVQKDRNSF